jgi:hypothetical protein
MKPPKPFLFQGNADSLAVRDRDGRQLTFRLPPWSWLQVQDDREWNNNKTIEWFVQVPVTDAGTYTVQIALAGGGIPPSTQVDKFGQSMTKEYPAKIHSVDDLKADRAAEEAELAAAKRPTHDAFGGLPDSGAQLGLKNTGFFHVEKQQGKWFLADPAGNAFFHLGICGFGPGDDYTYVAGREGIYDWLPPFDGEYHSAYRNGDRTAFSFYIANWIRKYGKPFDMTTWSEQAVRRAKAWGFNSVGAFSGPPHEVLAAHSFPYVSFLPLDPWDGKIPRLPGINETWDPFDEGIRAQVDRNFAAALPRAADDPLLIGYFLVNEPLYEDIPRVVPTLPAKYACKRALVAMLKDKYGTIDKFDAAWSLKAASFDELAERGLPVSTAVASEDMAAYTGLFFETFFKLVADTYHKYDTHHMLLGCRLQSGTINNETLCRTLGKYCDVMSFNYYTYGLDKDFLDRIEKWSGRPLMLSEFHWSSPPDSGLPGGAKDVATQDERGLAYRNYCEQAAARGDVIGLEWFIYIDQALTGRWFSKYNGENGNTGLVSVADRPWKVMLGEMTKSNDRVYDVMLGREKPYAYANERYAGGASNGRKVIKIGRAVGAIKLDGSAAGWPGLPAETIPSSRVVQGADAAGVEGSFKLCWDDAKLYLLAQIKDPTPMMNSHKGDGIWEADGLEVFIGGEQPDQGGALKFTDRQLLLSAAADHPWFIGNAPVNVPTAPLETIVLPNPGGGGYTLEAAIPFAALGFKPKVDQAIRFDLGIDDSTDGLSRRCQLMWNGSDRNSHDRSGWGSAVFAP